MKEENTFQKGRSRTTEGSKYLIKEFSSVKVRALVDYVKAVKYLKHPQKKGQLIEIFTSNILNSFLTKQFDIGTGFVINDKGKQSPEMDIIIYDNRILPPFINEQNIGVYPAESVIATIEVKSYLTKSELESAEISAKKLWDEVYKSTSLKPICAVIGFYGNGARGLDKEGNGKLWLKDNIKSIKVICLVNKFSWINWNNNWHFQTHTKTNEETKRFIAVLLDNIRTESQRRLEIWKENKHMNWFTEYIRDRQSS